MDEVASLLGHVVKVAMVRLVTCQTLEKILYLGEQGTMSSTRAVFLNIPTFTFTLIPDFRMAERRMTNRALNKK